MLNTRPVVISERVVELHYERSRDFGETVKCFAENTAGQDQKNAVIPGKLDFSMQTSIIVELNQMPHVFLEVKIETTTTTEAPASRYYEQDRNSVDEIHLIDAIDNIIEAGHSNNIDSIAKNRKKHHRSKSAEKRRNSFRHNSGEKVGLNSLPTTLCTLIVLTVFL